MSILTEIKETYRSSVKAQDILWNTYVARPAATILVMLLRRTAVTPNQVTMIGLGVFLLMLLPLWFVGTTPETGLSGVYGITLTVLLIELAYMFDCADGQLARIKGMTSGIGAYFDFLIDEIKALVLMGGFTVRLWLETGSVAWLLVGLLGASVASIATSLTQFVRRKEYTGTSEIAPGASAAAAAIPPGLIGKALWLVRRALSFVVHYPSWIWILPFVEFGLSKVASPFVWPLQDPLGNLRSIGEVVIPFNGSSFFIALYLGVYLLYLLKTTLEVILRLGSFSFYANK